MSKPVRRTFLFIGFFALILVAYFVLRLVFDSGVHVSSQFTEARTRGAVIAQDIVNDSNSLVEAINKVNALDKEKKYQEALGSLVSIQEQTRDIRAQAAELSRELQIMTLAIQDIDSDEARQAAVDSIASRIALEERLIKYTDEVNRLLGLLELHFRTGANHNKEIQMSVSEINAEVRAINNFNSQAGQAMDRFDAIVK